MKPASRRTARHRLAWRLAQITSAAAAVFMAFSGALPAQAASYPAIVGEGSSWAGNAWADWVAQAGTQGVSVTYTPNGSSVGRDDFARQTSAVFSDSEIPFTGSASDPQDNTTPGFKYGMFPVVAGGTAFMYNLPIGGTRFTNLKLNMAEIAGIFSGKITQWNDPTLQATNPGVALPAQPITVVVRSDGSGATAQFKLWMLRQYPADYAYLTSHTGGSATSASSYYPTGSLSNFTAQSGSNGVTTYTTNTPYTIDYDEYSYAEQAGFPVAAVENAAGYYTLPTADAVAVALTQAQIDTNPADPNYLSQDLSNVYNYGDPRTYTMSMYSYEIEPKQTNAVTTNAKGSTLAWLDSNAVCEWQREMGSLGYSPLPMNLVLASFGQIAQIPGIDSATQATIANTENGVLQGGSNPCNNPTFKPGDDPSHNVLVDTAPFPASCDAACQAPWKLPGSGTAVSGPTFQVKGTPTGGASGSDPAAAQAAAAAAAAKAKAKSEEVCNPNTGVCTLDAADAANVHLKAVPIVIGGQNGWGGAQTFAVLLGVLAAAALILPPVVGRVLSRSRRGPGGRP